MTFQILTAVSMKMTTFWDIAPCRLVGNRRFRCGYYLHHKGDDNEEKEEDRCRPVDGAVHTSETSVYC
jgi:hypothetical protein